jgi:hypothetical protein
MAVSNLAEADAAEIGIREVEAGTQVMRRGRLVQVFGYVDVAFSLMGLNEEGNPGFETDQTALEVAIVKDEDERSGLMTIGWNWIFESGSSVVSKDYIVSKGAGRSVYLPLIRKRTEGRSERERCKGEHNVGSGSPMTTEEIESINCATCRRCATFATLSPCHLEFKKKRVFRSVEVRKPMEDIPPRPTYQYWYITAEQQPQWLHSRRIRSHARKIASEKAQRAAYRASRNKRSGYIWLSTNKSGSGRRRKIRLMKDQTGNMRVDLCKFIYGRLNVGTFRCFVNGKCLTTSERVEQGAVVAWEGCLRGGMDTEGEVIQRQTTTPSPEVELKKQTEGVPTSQKEGAHSGAVVLSEEDLNRIIGSDSIQDELLRKANDVVAGLNPNDKFTQFIADLETQNKKLMEAQERKLKAAQAENARLAQINYELQEDSRKRGRVYEEERHRSRDSGGYPEEVVEGEDYDYDGAPLEYELQ